MKLFAILLSGLVLSILAAFGVQAATTEGKRVALVIGNSKYVNAVALPNPANDAHLIASTLRNAGFDVIEGVDQDNAGMHGLISKFTEESYNADLAVIFYAGHGMQVDGKNYLIPVDADLTSPAYLKTRTVQIDEFMAALPADPAVGVIILDACRDNPLGRTLAAALPKSRSLGAGLAPVDAKADGVGTGGVLIAYATDPGAIAFDGDGVDSPYSLALAKHLTEPGVEIQSALTRVRGDVTDATQGRQRPWHNASLGREVFLGKPAAQTAPPAVAPVADAAKTTAAPAPVASEPPSWEVEQRLWDEASKKSAIPYYEAYLDQFPNGRFATMARLDIGQLKDPTAGKQVAALDTNDANANPGPAVRTSAADQVRTAPPKKQVVQKTRTLKPVARRKPRKQQIVERWRNREIVMRDEPPRRDNNDFLTKALIFGSGVVIGGAMRY